MHSREDKNLLEAVPVQPGPVSDGVPHHATMDVVEGLMIRPVFLDVVHFKPNIGGNPDVALSVNGYSYQKNMEKDGRISIPFGLDRTNVIAKDLRGLIDIDIKPSLMECGLTSAWGYLSPNRSNKSGETIDYFALDQREMLLPASIAHMPVPVPMSSIRFASAGMGARFNFPPKLTSVNLCMMSRRSVSF